MHRARFSTTFRFSKKFRPCLRLDLDRLTRFRSHYLHCQKSVDGFWKAVILAVIESTRASWRRQVWDGASVCAQTSPTWEAEGPGVEGRTTGRRWGSLRSCVADFSPLFGFLHRTALWFVRRREVGGAAAAAVDSTNVDLHLLRSLPERKTPHPAGLVLLLQRLVFVEWTLHIGKNLAKQQR